MLAKLVNPTSSTLLFAAGVLALAGVPRAATAQAAAPRVVQNPSVDPAAGPVIIDFRADAPPQHRPRFDRNPANPVRFTDLDAYQREVEPSESSLAPVSHDLPEGLAQVGGMVVPEAMLDGAAMVPDAAAALAADVDPLANVEEWCAFPDEVPPGVYDYEHRPGGEIPRFHTVYLNFTGVPEGLFTGAENSAENLSNIARSGHPYPVYGGGEERAIAVAQAVAADFEDWGVRVAYLERPPKVLPYTMVMIGGHYSDTTAGPSGGVAPLDCEDFGQRNVCYAFQNNAPATSQANVVSQEIGHTLGLGHTSASDSVMAAGYANTQPGDLGFNDSCAPTIQVQGQSAACVGVNRCHCGVPDQQHDKRTLGTTFAPAGIDMVEPTLTLLSPADGSVYQEGEEIRVEFEPWDDFGGYGWKLMIENEAGELIVDQVDYDRALIFDLVGIPPGVYTFTGLIQDHADHIVTHSVTVTIEGDGVGAGTGADDDSGGMQTGGEGEGSGDATASDSTAGDDDAGLAGDGTGDDGCGCTTGPNAPRPAAALWMLGLLGLFRRRR
ncbi:MAG: matrixin family metalloprotease [Nannocystaceae bacterium]